MTTVDVEQFLDQLDAAITTATGRLGVMSMRVERVRATFKTVLEKNAEGGIELKMLSIGGGGGRERGSEVTVEFVPRGVVPAATLESELIDGLEVVAAAVDSLAERFDVQGASVELAFTTTLEGKIQLVVGGDISQAETHAATVMLKPVE